MTRQQHDDHGVAAIFVAALLVFLMGAAALAVDMSGFWQQARVQQTGADLACLAGVRHAPVDRTAAITKTAEFLRPNTPGLRLMSLTPSSTVGNISFFGVGGFKVEIETPYDDANSATRNDALMRVTVEQIRDTNFGRVIGSNQVTIVQEAFCQAGSPIAFGDLPLALGDAAAQQCAIDGTGCTVKYEEGNDCVVFDGPGACGSVEIPRHDDPPGTGTNAPPQGYIYNIALGANWQLAAPGEAGHLDDCASGAEPCGFLRDISGVKPDHITRGLISGNGGFSGRLDAGAPHDALGYPDSSSPTVSWDGHQLGDMASCTPSQSLGGCGGDTTSPAEVYKIFDCNEPRFTAVPVMDDFGPGLLHEYLRSHFAWIQEPDMAPDDPNQLLDPVHLGESEFESANKVQFVSIRILTFPLGESTPVENTAECGFYEFVDGAPSVVRLIQP